MTSLARRRFLQTLGLGAGATLLGPVVANVIGEARAVEAPQRRFVVFAAHGFAARWWRPPELSEPAQQTAGAVNLKSGQYQLPPMLEPLAAYQKDLLLIDGMDHDCRGVGEEIQHGGHYAALTLREQLKVPAGPSIDQYLARTLSKDSPRPSVNFGMWGEGSSGENVLDATTFATDKDRPLSHFINAAALQKELFGAVNATQGPSASDLREARLRDVLKQDLHRLNALLPGPEKERLALYVAAVEDYDRRNQARAQLKCDAPPAASLEAGPQAHMEAMFDLGILALKCGLTNVLGVATGTGGQSRHNLHMPIYESIGSIGSHDWNQDNLLKMHLLHTGMIARLWAELENTPSAGGTMADETVVLYVPTNGMTGEGTHHSISYMNNKNRAEWPVMMLSRIPGLRTGGDFIQFHPKSQNRTFAEFLHGLCEALSVDPSGFGKGSNGSDDFTGPMSEIRS